MKKPKTKYTPGPWEQGRNHDQEVFGPDGVRVAHCGTSFTMDDDEMTANAQLVATAPDLLKALKGVVDALEGCSNYLDSYRIRQLEAARAVIARATS